MNPDKGKEEKGGSEKPAGGPPGAGGAEGKPPGGAGAGKEEKCSGTDEPKGLQKIFDLYSKSGVGGGGSGLSKENGKKWMKAAGLLDEKTGVNEQEFEKAFDKALKGEKSVDFCGFKDLVTNLSKEKKKEPKEFFDKLVAAGPPKDAGGPSKDAGGKDAGGAPKDVGGSPKDAGGKPKDPMASPKPK